MRRGTLCLSAVRNPIHQLLVHQSEAVLGTTSHIWIDAQFASACETIYLHRATAASACLDTSLFPALRKNLQNVDQEMAKEVRFVTPGPRPSPLLPPNGSNFWLTEMQSKCIQYKYNISTEYPSLSYQAM